MNTNNLEQTYLGLAAKPALLVVDMINGFTDPACALGTHCPEVITANCQLLERFREQALPVFFTTVVYHNDQQASVFRAKLPALNVLEAGSHWVDVDKNLGRLPSEPLIEKQWP
ncbi:MAG: isochorismatase family protein, partial [Pseudomonadales bacterium]|nr:isochorismatase family protein [Pseudomonadales bacterium]